MEGKFFKPQAMDKPFEIKFDFPLAHSDQTIKIRATASLHHSEPYYVVEDFHFAGSKTGTNQLSILPAQEIKEVKKGKTRTWVHRDSERESLLSQALGDAIQQKLKQGKD